MIIKKNIGLVAHDSMKCKLVDWLKANYKHLKNDNFICTGTTGLLIKEMLENIGEKDRKNITLLKSGPLGGDQQLGAMIADGKIDMLFFFTDPMTPQPHDVDVKALMRMAIIYDIPMASNLSTADFIINSNLLNKSYKKHKLDYSEYISRKL